MSVDTEYFCNSYYLHLQMIGRWVKSKALLAICPAHVYCVLDDGMGFPVEVGLQQFMSAKYYAESGARHE